MLAGNVIGCPTLQRQPPPLRHKQQQPVRCSSVGAFQQQSPPPANIITKQITRASSTVELLQLHAAYRGLLDSIHYAALWSKLLQASNQTARNSTVMQPHTAAQQRWESTKQQQVLPQQLDVFQQQQQHPEQHRRLLLEALLADLPHIIHSMQPGPLAAVLRALVKLHARLQPQLLLAVLHRAHMSLGLRAFSPRELCTLAAALAELQPVDLPWTPAATQQLLQQGANAAAAAAASAQHQFSQASSSSSCGPTSWDPVLLHDLFGVLGLSLQRCNAQDLAQALLAVARLGYVPSEAWLQLWLVRANQLLPHFTPQGLANAAYGLVRTLQLQGLLPSTGTHDWALSSSSRSVHPQQQQPSQQGALLAAARAWLQSCLKVSVLHCYSLKPQELLGQLLWAAGKLSCMPTEPARHHLMTAAHAMLPQCDARHLCAALYAFALLDLRPDAAAARVMWSRLAHYVAELKPRDLAQVLWSAGKLQLQPPLQLRAALQQQALVIVAHRPLQQQQQQVLVVQCGPRHVVGVLRGMVVLAWPLQDKFLLRFQRVLLEQLEGCVPQDYANTLWALAKAGVKVEGRWLDRVLMATSNILDQFLPMQLANMLWALGQLQHQPPKPWMQQLLLSVLQQMSHFKAADHTQTLQALSKLGFTPSSLWLSSFWSKSGQCLTESKFDAGELHTLLLAAVKIEVQPPAKWVQAAATAVEQGLAGFASQQLLEVLQALQQLWQASSNSSAIAAAPAAAAAVSGDGELQASFGGSSSSRGLEWSSSVVSLSRQTGPVTWGFRVLLASSQATPGSSSDVHCASSSTGSSRHLRQVAPGVLRLYRQLSPHTLGGSYATASRMSSSHRQLLRPVWPLNSTAESSSRQHLQYQQLQEPGMGQHAAVAVPHHNAAATMHNQTEGLQDGVPVFGPVCADEAYSLACLVMLMPPRLRSRLDHWPQRLAASMAQQQPLLLQR